MTDEIVYRPARADDLVAAARVYMVADEELETRLFGRSMTEPSASGISEEEAAIADLTILHGEGPDRVWVATHGAEMIGVAAAAIRERHWHLIYLFVVPPFQAKRIGRELLSRMHGAGLAAGCDRFSLQASRDPKALSRYIALGLMPGPPTIDLRARAPVFPPLRWDDGLEARPLDATDETVLATVGDLDRVVRGARRPADLRRWLSEGGVGELLTRRETGTPAGYYLLTVVGAEARIGPVAAIDEELVGPVLERALAAAGALHRPDFVWRLDLPGENRAAIAPLFAAGFRPHHLVTFFSSGPIGRFDRYVLYDGDFL